MQEYIQTDEFITNLQDGAIIIQNGQVVGMQVPATLNNWDFIKECNITETPMNPEMRAVKYKGQPKIIIYDDPYEFDQEFKLFD